ncbi:hypothetical protein BV22DRAFT_1051384 [Leucogyrophana mollusca]|uniref:Uncharacterized protein n=1 Tax=Leucogyrophana mollusca TaxID=85980 RepID=A0ACB8AZX8_9AGAM|nr:hypothetical protein BV22DRAFT_1051384 [Leucogyrophana mollusca]
MPHHERYFPPVTYRLVFPPDRSPSPPFADHTLRKIFGSEPTTQTTPLRFPLEKIRYEPHRRNDQFIGLSHVGHLSVKAPDMLGRCKPSSVPPLTSPDGPLSKPNSGGYALKDALGWDEATYKVVQSKDMLHVLARHHFNTTHPYHEQGAQAQAAFLQAALHKFPNLAAYADAWPAVDFATMYLGNTTFSHRATFKASRS